MNFFLSAKGIRARLFFTVLSLAVVPLSFGQGHIRTPLYLMPTVGVADMNGTLLEGSTYAHGPLVQVLSAEHGIHPPNQDGLPHELNEPLPNGESYIGRNISPALEQSGLFSVGLRGPRPSDSEPFFVRVYSHSSPEDSLFYADSEIMTATDYATTLLYADVGPLTNIVSLTRDTDGDGLPDWWEYQYFGDVEAIENPDELREGHRMTAREAFIAGTDPTDPDSVFFITAVAPQYSDEYTEFVWTDPEDETHSTTTKVYEVVGHILSWPTVPERLYTIEYTTNILSGSFTMLLEDEPAHVNTFTNSFSSDEAVIPRFYRARVRLSEELMP